MTQHGDSIASTTAEEEQMTKQRSGTKTVLGRSHHGLCTARGFECKPGMESLHSSLLPHSLYSKTRTKT